MRIGLSSPQDVLALLVRRRWWVLGPFLALSCAIAVLTKTLPKVFVSQSLVLVRPRDVPQEFVMDLIGSTQDRLKSIEQTVLSRTNLLAIINEFGDELPEFRRFNVDEKVGRLRKEIDIKFQTDLNPATNQPTTTYFTIAYGNQNPAVAQKIAGRLTTLFIQQDNTVRERNINGTTDFLKDSLKAVEVQLQTSEAQLKDVRGRNQFELPEQRDANLKTLERLGFDKRSNAESVARNQTLTLNLETLLASTPQFLVRPGAPLPNTTNPAARLPGDSSRVAIYRQVLAEYELISSKNAPGYPDVAKAKLQLDRAKAALTPEELVSVNTPAPAAPIEAVGSSGGSNPSTSEPNPAYQRLLGDLKIAKSELNILEGEKANMDADIAKYSRRVENTPKTEQQIADLDRDTAGLQKQYDDLRSKLTQAELSEKMESQQRGTQFVTVDSANYPLEASKPNKMMMLLGGCLGSLVISILIAAVVDIARQRVWTQSEVERFWGVPVLVEIPEILIDSDVAAVRKKRIVFALSSAGAVILYGVGLYLMYLKHNFILQQLDPVLEKIIYK